MPLPPPAILITGASTGIGHAIARRCARDGWRVYAGVRREADAVALLSGPSAGQIVPLFLDVTDPGQIATAATRIEAEQGEAGLTGLVNNAGIAVGGPLEYLPLDRLRTQLEVNVTGQIAVTQAFLPLLRRTPDARRGRIVFIGSVSGLVSSPGIGAYSASKHALEALTDALRMELAPWNIEVVIIEPGVVITPIWAKSKETSDAMIAAMPPIGREYYGTFLLAIARMIRGMEKRGVPSDAVADAVSHALTARRPRTRYVVGRLARFRIGMHRILPDRLYDRLVLSVLARLTAPRSGSA